MSRYFVANFLARLAFNRERPSGRDPAAVLEAGRTLLLRVPARAMKTLTRIIGAACAAVLLTPQPASACLLCAPVDEQLSKDDIA
ncbi:MAG TPA: hypothetical protein VKB92_09410 [Myxococcales bacterium]|nr:hypothetical protein [Myxococcales bacterium]